MKISVDLIKELREMTSSSVAHCKKALEETKGDLKKAAVLLRKQGLEIAAKKQCRAAKEGRVESYIHHGNKIGVLLEVDCESDFVARNEDFVIFAKDVAMQIAATSPLYLKKEDVPTEVLESEKSKEDFCKNHCLMEQVFVKDPSITINDYLGSIVAKVGENVVIRRFIRYKIGE
ncbi:MAG: elongation factor Ts [Candidatus Omnitrophica bacterium]|jgi:elongation factor Ts|nr:elongation factor Ts [Candidatus Omnitrophota bacterium]MDD3987641.1 elongation factor Ts [Candidatus Omnitrophota bacterium]MDD4981178.1 elongation factor Ts [Candidatus Omnitrophota bacterium]MDD5665566.1 elongation factor Ts [Candidatus Omnitrophota bacterium]